MSTFDADELLNMQAEGSMETRYTPCPEGEWPAYVSKLEGRSGESEKGPWTVLDVTWTVTAPEVIQELGVDEPKVRQSIFLEFNEAGQLAMGKGKNVRLGRLREAVGQNGAGPWAPGNLEGASAIVRVGHREYQGDTYAEVTAVSAA